MADIETDAVDRFVYGIVKYFQWGRHYTLIHGHLPNRNTFVYIRTTRCHAPTHMPPCPYSTSVMSAHESYKAPQTLDT